MYALQGVEKERIAKVETALARAIHSGQDTDQRLEVMMHELVRGVGRHSVTSVTWSLCQLLSCCSMLIAAAALLRVCAGSATSFSSNVQGGCARAAGQGHSSYNVTTAVANGIVDVDVHPDKGLPSLQLGQTG